MEWEFNSYYTLIAATLVLLVGKFLVQKIKFLRYSYCFQTALRTEKSKVGRLYPFRSFLSTTTAKFYPQIPSMHKTRCHTLANEKFLY